MNLLCFILLFFLPQTQCGAEDGAAALGPHRDKEEEEEEGWVATQRESGSLRSCLPLPDYLLWQEEESLLGSATTS